MDTDGQCLTRAFLAETKAAILQEQRRITHSLSQLTDEQVWHEPSPGVNSIGTIIVHLCGNLRQWFLHGLGGEEDVRDRPKEFQKTDRVAKEDLLARLDDIVSHVVAVLDGIAPNSLLAPCQIQGFEVTGLSAIYSTVTHLEGHSLQIAYVAHQQLGTSYEPFWRPESAEQGAP
ncbi:MAG: DUF1572 domain-containing protein [bacterium]|nr:DUF1572 domain-containing protein [bacterium]